MKTTLLILASLMTCLTLVASDRIVKETFEVNPGADFYLSSHKGNIKVTTDNGHTVRITARIYVENGDDDTAVEYTEIKTTASKNYVRVKVDYHQKEWKSLWSGLVGNEVPLPYVDFEVILPDDLNLKLNSHKSRFEIDAPAGEIQIESHKGRGYIRKVRNHFSMESHKGDFEVDILNMRDLIIETHKGTMDVRIEKAKDFTLRGTTHKGDLEVRGREVSYKSDDRGKDLRLHERFGKGTNRVRLDTHKGRIRLDFVN